MKEMKEEIPWKYPLIPVEIPNEESAYNFQLPFTRPKPSRPRLSPVIIPFHTAECNVLSYKDKPWPEPKDYPPIVIPFHFLEYIKLGKRKSQVDNGVVKNDSTCKKKVFKKPIDSPYSPNELFMCSRAEKLFYEDEAILDHCSTELLATNIRRKNLPEDVRVLCFSSDMKQRKGLWNNFFEGRKSLPLERLCVFYLEKSCLQCKDYYKDCNALKNNIEGHVFPLNDEENNNHLSEAKEKLSFSEKLPNLMTDSNEPNCGSSQPPLPDEDTTRAKPPPPPEEKVDEIPLPNMPEKINESSYSAGQQFTGNYYNFCMPQYQWFQYYGPYFTEGSNYQQMNYPGPFSPDGLTMTSFPFLPLPPPPPPPPPEPFSSVDSPYKEIRYSGWSEDMTF